MTPSMKQTSTERLERLGFKPPEGELEAEDDGHRCEARDGDGGEVLYYVWSTSEGARRALRAMGREDLGGQLFAVPEVLAGDAEARWGVIARPEGEPLARWLKAQGKAGLGELDPKRSRAVIEALGVLMRKLHSIASPGLFGEVLGDAQVPEMLPEGTYRTFNGWVAAKLERLGEALNHYDALSPSERLDCLGHLGDLRHELSAFHPRHPAVLSHGSPGVDNLWVSGSGAEITGLTGFDHACYLPAEADLANLLFIEGIAELGEVAVSSFYRGYGSARTMDVQRRERFYRRIAALEVLTGQRQSSLQLSTTRLLHLASPSVV